MKYAKNQTIDRIKILIFILVFFVFLIVLIKNLNISIYIKEFIIGVAFLLFIIYLFLMYFEVKKVQMAKVKLPKNDVSNIINDELTFQNLFKEYKFEEFKQKVSGLEVLNKNSLKKRKYINAVLYYKLMNNNYLFEWVEPTTIYHKFSQVYFDVKYHNSNFSKNKIEKMTLKSNKDSMSNAMKVYYYDLKVLGDN
ncbi:protein of unknown function [Tenacibaculum sp. 190130A14a]|uniref:hypothetical protein n=1 Tax=Tenacibaculum polynesiense TaxID=3137857 RepID=UPI0032B2D97B